MRVIVVEDEAPIRNGLGQMIGKVKSDYQVVATAENGEEGLKKILELKPDLVIMDIQMPKMDGLTMLRKLRESGSTCKVVVLSAYSDFQYAKQAIELVIVSYLLKPIRVSELKKTLEQIEETIEKEGQSLSVISMEEIVIGKLTGQLEINEQLDLTLKRDYGFCREDKLALTAVWPGDHYEDIEEEFCQRLEKKIQELELPMYRIPMQDKQVELLLFYGKEDYSEVYQVMQREVVPFMVNEYGYKPVFIWRTIENLKEGKGSLDIMYQEMEWNLAFGPGVLIDEDKIKDIHTSPFAPSTDLEKKIRQSIIKRDYPVFKDSFQKFSEECQVVVHNPKDIKEASVQFCLTVLTAVNENGRYQKDLAMQPILEIIGKSISWYQIQKAFQKFYGQIVLKDKRNQEGEESAMISQAKRLIRDRYQEGVTLEEIAHSLYVSDEYLSAQFKKETGITFSETIRNYRIERIKELLLSSHLKLNQIADMTGYSDPKYMSKVFKENVGMSPAEYRKNNSDI